MAVTLKELARALKLDHSTVAYALSGKGTIADKTRAMVARKAAEMGYVPNRLARQLRSQQSRVIGLVVPDALLPYNDLVQQVFHGVIHRDYGVEVALTEFDPDLEDRALRSLLGARVDGVILKSRYGSWSDVPKGAAMQQLVARGVPTVTLDYPTRGSGLPHFQIPARRMGQMLTEHLLGLGHRVIAMLFPVPAPLGPPQTDRITGAAEAMRAAGLDGSALRVFTLAAGDAGKSGAPADDLYHSYINESLPRVAVGRGRALLRRALASQPRPTAVICYNDVLAIGALLEAREMGLRVPEDLAVAATGRSLAVDLAPVALTTVDAPAAEVVRVTLDLLFACIHADGATPPASMVTIEPRLTVAASTVGSGRGVGPVPAIPAERGLPTDAPARASPTP
jgi:LacI family transcriptional regulator